MRRALLTASLVLFAFVAWDSLSLVIGVDKCLDRGGVFDYWAQACRFDVTSLPAGGILSERGKIAAALALTALAAFALTRGRRRRDA